jgi:hypothetical protein
MAQQVQAKQRELQSKLEAMLASVEDERLRPMRKQGFLAMAKCCDLSDPTAYQQCLQKAQLPEQRASQVVQTELNDFQGRLQRAIATCQDDVKDGSRAASDPIFFTPSSQRLLAWHTHVYQGRRRTDGVELDASRRCDFTSRRLHRLTDHNTQAAIPIRTARRTSSTRVSERSSTRTRLCSVTSRSASRRDYVS